MIVRPTDDEILWKVWVWLAANGWWLASLNLLQNLTYAEYYLIDYYELSELYASTCQDQSHLLIPF